MKEKTRLVRVEALYLLCDKGPQPDPRYKWAYNGLIAGTDPVAVETVCLKILTEKRKALKGEPWPITPHLSVWSRLIGLVDWARINGKKSRLPILAGIRTFCWDE